jgi:hypothetical protein
VGTPLEDVPSLQEQAEAVVKMLNDTQKPERPYLLMSWGEIKYNRDYAFATVKNPGHTLSMLIDPRSCSGTIRRVEDKPKVEQPIAPFVISLPEPAKLSASKPPATRLGVKDSLHDRVLAAMPTILERTGQTVGTITVTSVPELVFPIIVGDATWIASYNSKTDTITAKMQSPEKPELSLRRYLTQLHKAHGYPGEVNARWSWAIVVDAMAFVLCFWGLSGLVMWWQIKSTRRIGAIVLIVSAIAATALGLAMYAAMTQT